jgi:hypothetical protein
VVSSGVTVVLRWCHSGVTVNTREVVCVAPSEWHTRDKTHLCHRGVTVVLQWCYSGVTVVLQLCYTVVTQWWYSGGTVHIREIVCVAPSQGYTRKEAHLCHSGVTVVLQWCYSGVTVV